LGFYKKTVLLSNQSNYDSGMAILTIEQNNSGVFGSLKAFDLPKSEKLILGISVDGKQVIKQNVAFLNGNIFSFKLNNDFEINGKIGSVLVDVNQDNVKALIWGTNGFQAEYKKDIIHIIEKETFLQPQTKKKDIAGIKNDFEITPKIAEVKAELNEIKNKKDEFSQASLFESDDNEVEDIIDHELNKENNDFYDLIGEQVDELFKKFPLDYELSNIIPNSKWIKVDYENNGKTYVLGLIYEISEIKYICYGVPGKYDVLPPVELQEFSQWLPFEKDGIQGYWLMFQDAKTGDSVLIDKIKFS